MDELDPPAYQLLRPTLEGARFRCIACDDRVAVLMRAGCPTMAAAVVAVRLHAVLGRGLLVVL